jgi:TRAP-type C4-dicarboxylate transport system substrate-binding protein
MIMQCFKKCSAILAVALLAICGVWANGGSDNGEVSSGADAGPQARDKVVEIKIISVVPQGTPWQEYVDKLADAWWRISNHKIRLNIYYGSQLGEYESDIITQMKLSGSRAGGVQGAILTSVGMGLITPKVMTLSYPLLIHNEAELDAVLAQVQPEMEQSVTDAGYHVLAWSRVGWIKFFGRKPIYTPQDLNSMKLASGDDLKGLNDVLKTMGFTVVNTAIEDTLIAMNSGSVDATYQSPILIAAEQVFGVAKYMTNFNIAPAMGGLVITKTAWQQVQKMLTPEQIDEINKETAKDVAGLNAAAEKLETYSIQQMVQNGLVSVNLTPQQKQAWYDIVNTNSNAMENNSTFDPAFFKKVKAILANYRKAHPDDK